MVDLIGIILFIVVLGSIYAPFLLLTQSRKFTSQELKEEHPELAWVTWIFHIYQLMCLLFLFLLLAGLFGIDLLDRLSLWPAALCGGMVALSGMFAIITGVFVAMPFRYTYRYVCDDKARLAGLLQGTLGTIIVITAISI